MATVINPVAAPTVATTSSLSPTAKPGGAPAAFSSLLSEAIGRVDQSNKVTQDKIDRYLSGENDEIHETAMAVQRNELQFEMFLQVRNKMVQAYQEVMRMQM